MKVWTTATGWIDMDLTTPTSQVIYIDACSMNFLIYILYTIQEAILDSTFVTVFMIQKDVLIMRPRIPGVIVMQMFQYLSLTQE